MADKKKFRAFIKLAIGYTNDRALLHIVAYGLTCLPLNCVCTPHVPGHIVNTLVQSLNGVPGKFTLCLLSAKGRLDPCTATVYKNVMRACTI